MSVLTTTPLKAAPSAAAGVAIAAGLTPAWGAWVQVIASTAAPIAVAGVMVSGGTYAAAAMDLDIGTGGAGAEASVGTLRLYGLNSGTFAIPRGLLLRVPLGGIGSGVRVAVRLRADPGGAPTGVALLYYESLSSDQVTTASQVLTAAPATGVVSLTPSATPWAPSAWVELIASAATDLGLLGLVHGDPSAGAEAGVEYDLGTGAAGAETVLTTLRQARTLGIFPHTWLPGLHPIAAGTRVSVRMRKAGTSTTAHPVALLAYTNVAPPAPPVTEGLVITINDEPWTFREGSMTIHSTLNGLDTLSGLIDILDDRDPPTLRQEIVVTEDGVRLFGGRIEALEYRAITADASQDLTVELDAQDFNALADDRTVPSFASPGGETLKEVLTRLVAELASAGVTLSPTQVDGPILAPFTFTLRTVREILEELSGLTQFVFEIDYDKVLRMWQPGTVAAPFDLVDGDRKAVGDIVITPIASDYANRILVRGGVAGSYTPQENVFAWYSDGVTNVFPMYTHVLNHFGQVLVDTPLETVPGEGYESVGPPGSGALWEFHETAPPGVPPPAAPPGSTDWPAPFTQWLSRAAGPPPAGNVPPAVPYPIQFKVVMDLPMVVVAEDLDGEDPVEKLIDQGSDAGAWWQLQEIANNRLTRHKSRRSRVRYATLETGLRIGQSQTLTIARRDLSGPYFITDVETRMLPKAHRLIRTITAEETELYQGSWRDVYTLWAENSAGGGGGTTTTGGTLPPTGTPYPHHASHEPGGTDPMTVDSTASIGSLRTLGTGANQAAAGNDSRFTDARPPTTHGPSHQSGGSDAIKLDDLAAPDDTTDLNASASAHGLLRKLSGNVSEVLRGDGTWGAGSGGTPTAHHATHEPGGSDALVAAAWTDVANTFTEDQTIDGDLLVTGTITPLTDAQRANINALVGDPTGARALMSEDYSAGLSLRHDQAQAVGRIACGNYDTQTYQPLRLEVETFEVHSGTSPALRVEHVRVHPSGGVTVGAPPEHASDPGTGVVVARGLGATPLNATQLTSGTVADARLATTVARRDQANTFSEDQRLERVTPVLHLFDTAAPADARLFRVYNGGQQFVIDAATDSGTPLVYPLYLTRTGDLHVAQNLYEQSRAVPLGHRALVPYHPSSYIADAPAAWLVDAADQVEFSFSLVGQTLTVWVEIANTTISGGTPTTVYLLLPNGYAAAAAARTLGYGFDGATWQPIVAACSPGSGLIGIQRLGFAAWPAVTNGLFVSFTITLPIQ